MSNHPGSSFNSPFKSAISIATKINSGELRASSEIANCLQRIESLNPKLNCFTEVINERAIHRAAEIDKQVAQGKKPGALAGVPFAVKNLFDIDGMTTLAGSKINTDNPAADKDAVLIKRLEDAGAILVGALSMGEYAYDFTGENEHYGNCRNPWDTSKMCGGSSSGSGTALAAGLVALTLGSDTNGSIRVPSSLCGVYGLKPTYGRLPRTGSYPFCDSLDHLGPLARNTDDLALGYDLMQGWDSGDPACADITQSLTCAELDQGIDDLRIARATGYFDCSHFPEAQAALDHVCSALKVTKQIPLEGAEMGRAAAYIITNSEGSALHRTRLQTRIEDFDADTKDRFLAGSLIPAGWYLRAQAVRQWWQNQMLDVFKEVNLILAPATPCSAPDLGTQYLNVRGEQQLLRPNLGLFTQPFSAIGLPVVSVPIWLDSADMPIGVQIVAPPWREDLALRAAKSLELSGIALCRNPPI